MIKQYTHCYFSAPQYRYELITRNLQEVLGGDIIKSILKERDIRIYWGTACTGRPHIGYYLPIVKLADFLKAGCEVTVLVADLHGYLDNRKAGWDQLKHKKKYYEIIIRQMLHSIKVPTEKLKFVTGSSFQLTPEYSLDLYHLVGLVTEHDARKAGTEVVKQTANPILSGLIYPLLQALDEEYLRVDCQFGGLDQRKIFIFAEKHLPYLGYKKRAHLLNTMLPGLTGSKMSSSEEETKIDIIDSEADIRRKISRAFCEVKNVTSNPVLVFIQKVITPIIHILEGELEFTIDRPEKFGGPLHFDSYDEVEAAFALGQIHPADIKKFASDVIIKLTKGAREAFSTSENLELLNLAYPEKKNINPPEGAAVSESSSRS